PAPCRTLPIPGPCHPCRWHDAAGIGWRPGRLGSAGTSLRLRSAGSAVRTVGAGQANIREGPGAAIVALAVARKQAVFAAAAARAIPPRVGGQRAEAGALELEC